jgi:hypothetical protein
MCCMRCGRAGAAAQQTSAVDCSGGAPQASTHMAQQGNETLSYAGPCAAWPCTRHALTAAARAAGPLQRPVHGQYASHVQSHGARCAPLHGLLPVLSRPHARPAYAAPCLAEQQAARSPHSRLAERVSMVARGAGARHALGAAGRAAGVRRLRAARSRVSGGLLRTPAQCVDACSGRPSGVGASPTPHACMRAQLLAS